MKSNLILALLLATLLQGCSTTRETTEGNLLSRTIGEIPEMQLSMPDLTLPSIPGIYRADIHQGNIVEQKMVDQLKPGMEMRQVRYIMGSPLIVDTFHQQRWDYYSSRKSEGEMVEKERITLFFDQGKLTRIEGDLMPATAPKPEVSVEIGDLEVLK